MPRTVLRMAVLQCVSEPFVEIEGGCGCVCVCMYLCVHVCVYMYNMYMYMYIYIRAICTPLHMCLYTYMHIHAMSHGGFAETFHGESEGHLHSCTLCYVASSC